MQTHDFVIVGGGSAGCVLAARLSASGRHSVLLLEAGGADRHLWLRMPIGYGMSFYNPRVNWMYRTEPDAQLDGRQGYWPRGKVLGGSGSINAMVFVRGQPGDFDDWAAAGNPGWDWAGVLPWFRRMEDSSRTQACALRGHGGPLAVTNVSRDLHPLCATWLAAGREAGFGVTPDFNGAQPEGVGLYEITMRGGLRVSASTAYLAPARGRANLQVRTDARATRLVLEGSRAVGVRYLHGGHEHEVRARREVIVCAGAVNSPQLLMLSGIGPAEHLRAQGIGVALDSPQVGRNLQDHLCIDHLYRARVPTLNNQLRPWWGQLAAGARWLLTRGGPLALSVNQGGGFVRSRAGLARPDMQLYFSPLSYLRARPGKRELMRPDPYPGFLVGAQPCRPESRGEIRLRSADPLAAPLIAPNSLATERDRQDMLAAARLVRRIAATPAMQGVIDTELVPGAAVLSDEALMDDARRRASTVFHPVSTCRMGPGIDTAVLDAQLRVHGMQALRVIDASAFPSITSGNTNAPTIMLAEKGADMVLREHGDAA